jgi:hypothetical protein
MYDSELIGITFELRKGGLELFFLTRSLGTTTTGAESLRGGLHAAPVTDKDAVVAALAHSSAFWRILISSGVTTIKNKIVRGHLNRSLENINALVPWDKSWNLRRYLPRPIALCASLD